MARYEFFKVGNKTVGYDISLEDSIGRNLFAYLLTAALFAFLGSVLATIIPAVLFIVYFYTINEQKWLNNAVGAVFCLYFLLDYHFGWLCYGFFNNLVSDKWYNRFIVLNLGLLITNIILLTYNLTIKDRIFNEPIDKNISHKEIAIGLMLGIMFVSSLMFDKVVTKYKEPIKTEEQIKVEQNQMY